MKVRRVKPYVCVDCDFAEHFRFQDTKDLDAAAGTWLRCLAHSRAQEQDGVVRAVWARRAFAGTFERVEELVAVGLLLQREDGDYEIRGYAPRNQTTEMLGEARTLARDRKLAWQAQRAAAKAAAESAVAGSASAPPAAPVASKREKANRSTGLALVEANSAAGTADAQRTNSSALGGEGTLEERVPNAFVPTSTSTSLSTSSSTSTSNSSSTSTSGSPSTSTSPSTSSSFQININQRSEIHRGGPGGDSAGAHAVDEEGPPRTPLPASERGVSGQFWLSAFTDGVTDHTQRPCTAGRVYVATLERLVTHHAPQRDAASACVWLRAEARAFAAKWEGKHPAKGLTPDGLERWLNDGRQAPPEFGRPRIVQPAAEDWHEDDWSDLGAEVMR